ncbi:MAG TPA: MIP/aquaporin family protein [Thermomicrobiales bacterium]|nr:MIP/aquaporin family protein [Thermomicrobiales bacterium]
MVTEDLARRLAAELIGTFLLVFIGCGAVVTNTVNADGASGLISIAFAFGFALMVIVYAIGHISGAHVNPAVSLGLVITRRFPAAELLPYWVAQVVGALIAAAVLRLTFDNVAHLGTTMPTQTTADALVVELVMTAVLVFVVCGVATDKRAPAAAAGLAIGGAVVLNILVAGPISGGSVNPARSIGPAVMSGEMGDLWIYLVAPLVGGVIGAMAYQLIRGAEASEISVAEGTTTEVHRADQSSVR